MNTYSKCRFCDSSNLTLFLDLGMSPLCQTHISKHELNSMERFYPLKTLICKDCMLVQLDQYVSSDEIFSDYDYFSSYSTSWVNHAKSYVDHISSKLNLSNKSLAMEIASNDGYLLQHFVAKDIPCLGIEPAANVAQVAIDKGIRTEVCFLGEATAKQIVNKHGKADLVLGNNVLAHVPDLNDFISGIKTLMAPNAVLTMEFPHLLQLMQNNQFDTIYHEHFSYFAFNVVQNIFAKHGIKIYDVEELKSHGGSLRIYGAHSNNNNYEVTERAKDLVKLECQQGLNDLGAYNKFAEQVKFTKRNILDFLVTAKSAGKSIVGYGAPGKANTLLNYCGIREDFLDYVVDKSPQKQDKFTPGTHIPILSPELIAKTKPDYVVIMPWNLKQEISDEISYIRDWGAQFVTFIPEVTVW